MINNADSLLEVPESQEWRRTQMEEARATKMKAERVETRMTLKRRYPLRKSNIQTGYPVPENKF